MLVLDGVDVIDRTRVAVAVDARGVMVGSTLTIEVVMLDWAEGGVDDVWPMTVGTSGP